MIRTQIKYEFQRKAGDIPLRAWCLLGKVYIMVAAGVWPNVDPRLVNYKRFHDMRSSTRKSSNFMEANNKTKQTTLPPKKKTHK